MNIEPNPNKTQLALLIYSNKTLNQAQEPQVLIRLWNIQIHIPNIYLNWASYTVESNSKVVENYSIAFINPETTSSVE